MKVTVENKKGLNKDIKVFIDKKTMNSYMDEKYEEIKGTVNLKGFRPGKVPVEVLKRQFGKAVFSEVLDKVLKDTTTKALEENKIKPAGQPKLDLKTYGEDKDLEYIISVTELPKIDIRSISNIKFDEYSVKIDENETDKLMMEYLDNYLEKVADKHLPEDQMSSWKFDALDKTLSQNLGVSPDFNFLSRDKLSFGAVMDFLNNFYQKFYYEKFESLKERRTELERQIAVQVLDAQWKRHLQNIDSLRSNIGLRAYAQRNPINEFKKESFHMFDAMIESFKDDVIKILMNIKITKMSKEEFERQKKAKSSQ